MHFSPAKSLSGFHHIKTRSFTVVALLGALTAAGCSTNYNVAQTTSSSVTKVGYSLPAERNVVTQAGVIKTTRSDSAPHAINTERASAKRTTKVASSAYLGRAPHICTPSGFGSKTRCFNRS